MIKVIIFDFDGVIIDNYELHYALSQKQITGITREEHKKLFEGNVNIERKKLSHRNTGFDIKKYSSDLKGKMIIREEVKEVLKLLSKKFTLGIITSAREYGIQDCLEKNQLNNLFSFVYGHTSAILKTKKFEKVCTEYNSTADECVFVTDTLGDILEAHEAGVRTIAVDFGYHEKERLMKGSPAAIISQFSELPTVISKMNK